MEHHQKYTVSTPLKDQARPLPGFVEPHEISVYRERRKYILRDFCENGVILVYKWCSFVLHCRVVKRLVLLCHLAESI